MAAVSSNTVINLIPPNCQPIPSQEKHNVAAVTQSGSPFVSALIHRIDAVSTQSPLATARQLVTGGEAVTDRGPRWLNLAPLKLSVNPRLTSSPVEDCSGTAIVNSADPQEQPACAEPRSIGLTGIAFEPTICWRNYRSWQSRGVNTLAGSRPARSCLSEQCPL